jgi:CheY-like chemotaxis protein
MNTIAVVDDDIHWCYVIERFFRNDLEVYTFPTVSAFLKQLFDYDLVIVDYSIPPVNYEENIESCELIHHLKTNLRYPPLVVLISGYVNKNDCELGKKICPEADAFLTKDAGLDELLRQIKQLIASNKKHTSYSHSLQNVVEYKEQLKIDT